MTWLFRLRTSNVALEINKGSLSTLAVALCIEDVRFGSEADLTVSQMLERPFYHPVVEEDVRTPLQTLNFALEMGPQAPPRCLDCSPSG